MLLEFLELSQQVDHCRHQYCLTDAFSFDRLAEAPRAKLRNRDLADAESRCGEHERKIQDVKNRRGVEMYTTFSVGHPVVEMVHIREDIRVSQHNAFGTASCSARVDES